MAARNLLRETWRYIIPLYNVTSGDSILLMAAAVSSLLIETNFPEDFRTILAISIICEPRLRPPTPSRFVIMAPITAIASKVFYLPGGTLTAIGLWWLQNRVLPSAKACILSDDSEIEVWGELSYRVVPLLCFGLTIVCIKCGVGFLGFLWSWLCSPVMWTTLVLGVGSVMLWNRYGSEILRSWTEFNGFAHVVLWFGGVLLRVSMFPYRLLAETEQLIIRKRDLKIEQGTLYDYKEHKKLQSGHIRLLELSRRTPFSGLRCRLTNVQLSKAPAYEAISYCWGTDPATKTVIIDGRPLRVLDSVYEVLHYRHSFWQPRVLWIDSVCINQNNKLEKEVQIQLMRTIFSQATSVIAWLGDTKRAWFARYFIFTLYVKKQMLGQTAEQLLNEYSNSQGWKYLGILLSNPWFTRIWMLQEIALARKVRLVFGGPSMDWEHFAGALPIICDPLLFRLLSAEHGIGQPIVGAINATIMASYRNRVQEGSRVTLDETLSFTLSFESTCGHDKIYAVLGLLTDESVRQIIPDYSKSVEKVFTETMRHLLRTPTAPSTFHLAGTGVERNLKLPCWVPDWTISNNRFRSMGNQPLYNAGTGYGWRVLMPPDENASFIRVTGNVVDEIVEIGGIGGIRDLNSDLGFREQDLAPMLLGYRAWILEGKTIASNFAKEPYFGGSATQRYQSREEAFWRTLIADHTAGVHPAPITWAENYAAMERWFGISAGSESTAPCMQFALPESERTMPTEVHSEEFEATSAFLFHVGAGSFGRCVAATKNGLLAIVPPMTKKGDLVSIIWGTQTPYLLRPHQMRIGGEKCWELVGGCFVHGLMNGEGLKEDGDLFTLVSVAEEEESPISQATEGGET
jgi:hypothetical protein